MVVNQQSNRFSSPLGDFHLDRYPLRSNEQLRAWDASDEYLLNYLSEQGLLASDTSILIVNDSFGAMAVSLAAYQPTMQTDSYIARCSTLENLKRNGASQNAVTILPSTAELSSEQYDLVLLRVTKTLALLEEQLIKIKCHISERTSLIGHGMAKHIHSSTLELFSSIVGETKTSLAWKKARLIFTSPDMAIPTRISPYPTSYRLDEFDIDICNHANVFSRERLDIGTLFFLRYIPGDERFKEIVDLGCGSGVIGVVAARKNPQASIHFIDESYMAVASARETAAWASLGNALYFQVADGLQDYQKQSIDLVLCNPPFHQQHAMGDFLAMRMFAQAKSVLRQGGELWIVGNRHLNYHIKLKKIFGNVKLIGSDRKFVVLRAVKR